MQNRVFMWGCAVLGAGFAFEPKPANACGCAASDGIEASKPGPGDIDVPTDVVPWVVAGGEVALIDEHGVVVPTRQERYAFGVACASPSGLIATEPLKPNARYAIIPASSVSALDEASIAPLTFTTGDGPAVEPVPAMPEMRLAVFDAQEFLNSCVYSPLQACLATDYTGLLDVRVLYPEGVAQYVGPIHSLENLELSSDVEEVCIEVRARDIAGRESAPWMRCVEPQSATKLAREEYAIYVSCSSPQVQALMTATVDEMATAEPIVTADETAPADEMATADATAPIDAMATVEPTNSPASAAPAPAAKESQPQCSLDARRAPGTDSGLSALTLGGVLLLRRRRARQL